MSPVTTIFDAEAEPGQEHLHLLAGGVLRLVENDERIVQGVMREQEILGDVEGVLSGDLNAYGFLSASGFDAVDVAHRSAATAGGVVLRDLA